MQVEVWADVICPWCGLGSHRLEAALERFPHRDEVQVTHRSFQLDPGAPAGSSEPVRDMLRKKGLEDGQIDAMTQRVEGLAEAEGLRPYHVLDNRVGSTALAHELLAYAADQGKQAEAWPAPVQRLLRRGPAYLHGGRPGKPGRRDRPGPAGRAGGPGVSPVRGPGSGREPGSGRAGRDRRAVLRDRPPVRCGGRPAGGHAARGPATGLG
jgi:hypothetical protein